MTPNLLRPSSEAQRRDLKSRFDTLVHQIGPVELAKVTRASVGAISKYCSHFYSHSVPIDIVLDAELKFGQAMMTELLAEFHGFDLVPKTVPVVKRPATDDDLMHATEEFGHVVSAWRTAKADGRVDALDKRNIKRELREHIAVLLDIERGL